MINGYNIGKKKEEALFDAPSREVFIYIHPPACIFANSMSFALANTLCSVTIFHWTDQSEPEVLGSIHSY